MDLKANLPVARWLLLPLLVGVLFGRSTLPAHADGFADNFGQSTLLMGPTNVLGSSDKATAQAGEPGHFGEPAQHSVWARWTPAATGTYTVFTTNAAFDTVLAVYLGTALDNLKAVSTNDDIDFRTTASQVTFRAYAGETFHIAVDGVSGAKGSFEARIGFAGHGMMPWTTTDLFGRPVPSASFTNRFVMFDFWETTCGACVDELYELFHLHQSLAPRGFTLLGLAMDTDPVLVYNFVIEYPFPYPIFMSSKPALASLAGPSGVGAPTKFLVDPERRIIGPFMGGLSPVSSTYPYYMGTLAPNMRSTSVPQLAAERRAGQVIVSWSDSLSAGYRLDSTDRPAGGVWSSAGGASQTNNGAISVTIPLDAGQRFFRLASP